MNIYFSCSITGGRQDQAVYHSIVQALQAAGHVVPTTVLSSPDILSLEAVNAPQEVYQRDIAWVEGCDAVVAEVSTPSHGVGYEIAYALGLKKPVLCCYQAGRRVSKMLTGNTHPQLTVYEYATVEDGIAKIHDFLERAASTYHLAKVSPLT